jgi:signal peptidase I
MDKAEAIEEQAENAPAPAKTKSGVADTTRFLIILFLFAVVLRSFVVAPFEIPSGSMLPRMMIGDYLFVAKWPYGYSRYSLPFGLASFGGRIFGGEPERGDVIVFRHPRDNQDWVKRLIGLPGDRVQMRDGQLFLNGNAVPKVRIADWLVPVTPNSPCSELVKTIEEGGRRFCAYPRYRETLPGGRSYEVLDQIDVDGPPDDTPVYVVPAGHYFMMGDNRDESADSRFTLDQKGVEFLPRDYLVGRALMTFFSTDGSAEWLKPWTWFSAARWSRIGGTY